MSTYGPYHRLGAPGGPGCQVAVIPTQGRTSDGAIINGSLLDAGTEATELELLRTVASGLGVYWGHDDLGWWAAVPQSAVSQFADAPSSPLFAEASAEPASGFHLYREDDNGARFLVERFDTREAAEQQIEKLAWGGHKQHYYIEPAGDAAS